MSRTIFAVTAVLAGMTFNASVRFAMAGALDPAPAYPGYPTSAPHPAILDPAPAYASPPIYDWTGFYVGINGGGSLGRAGWVSDPDLTSGTDTHSAGLLGGTIGYNTQTLGQWVVGEEFDFNWRRFDFSIPAATCGPPCTLQSNWFATARLRVGYAVDRFLPYVTGGVSAGDFDAFGVGQPSGVNRNVSFNFTAGAGVEVALSGPLTGKVEYLFVSHSRVDCGVECNGLVHISPDENVVRLGLNYRIWQR